MQILDATKIILITFIFSSIIMQVMKKVAVHIGAIDIPRSEEGQPFYLDICFLENKVSK